MNFFKQFFSSKERMNFEFIELKPRCRKLTSKQVALLSQLVDNYYKEESVDVCSCDVEFVLNMHDCSEVKRK